ncbi:MerR family transcriptional regulator [Caproiciproducens galactitolivorans]|uniref:MerR family transcriptional regulator n=1 Tax=Caproiciproducens galactitolivorans TaxID=642589 RepID=A0ABT4BUD0_9FIRM|nr:MerR family transcriptional regulator [Caproiciproducens galactitolivorans]MCY1713693.1 MerR family transcriptional regulator [Caproiciproducens galactitolivorans]
MKINEVAKLTGVTVRTLHYYDEIGLLKPTETTESGYRIYDESALVKLQQILFFRELGFPLDEIRKILSSRSFDPSKALKNHKDLLTKKRDRLNHLIDLTDKIMKGETTMSFQEFDTTEIENTKKKYAEEAKKRWGTTDAYRESEKKAANYKKEDWQKIEAESGAILKAFSEVREKPADCAEAQELVKRWQDFISAKFYACTKEILAGLGQMYTADERFRKNIDQYGSGTAEFLAKAIAVYCAKENTFDYRESNGVS